VRPLLTKNSFNSRASDGTLGFMKVTVVSRQSTSRASSSEWDQGSGGRIDRRMEFMPQ
jgi:hypothetical protein